MRSDIMKKGKERAAHRSLLAALGLTKKEIERPLIGVVNSANEIVPGHIHLGKSPKPSRPAYAPQAELPLNFQPLRFATVLP